MLNVYPNVSSLVLPELAFVSRINSKVESNLLMQIQLHLWHFGDAKVHTFFLQT